MDDIKFIEFLKKEGYFEIRKINGHGYCALLRFGFTVGLCVQLDETGYSGRYCFEHLSDAKEAINTWDGYGDPDGNWIKYKGYKGDYRNPKLPKEL